MWFEVNARLSEVTDLKWPHGTEWQCGYSTLAMSWANHVQILSFASMAPRQGTIKHGFVSKIAGGCSSDDVIAPWPDLTWSIFFYQKFRKACPIRYPSEGISEKVSDRPVRLIFPDKFYRIFRMEVWKYKHVVDIFSPLGSWKLPATSV